MTHVSSYKPLISFILIKILHYRFKNIPIIKSFINYQHKTKACNYVNGKKKI